jgi:hypothetical protein
LWKPPLLFHPFLLHFTEFSSHTPDLSDKAPRASQN